MTKLQDIASALSTGPGVNVSRRGESSSEFLYVETKTRAVEVSMNGAMIWVEYWDSTEQGASACREGTFSTPERAIESIRDWLNS